MRTVTFGCANSLDNFIARPDGAVDWLRWTPEVAELNAEYWRTVDTVVMGRGTYEAAVRAGMPAYPGVRNCVVSRTLPDPGRPGVEIVREDGVALVRRLRAEPGGGICIMGGGVLGHSLLEAGLVDELGVNIHPVLLGAGVPLFHGLSRTVELELLDSRVLPNGCVYLRYRVVRSPD